MEYKPILGITIGDVAGVGPEITAKALSKEEVYKISRPVIIGDKDAIEDGLRIARKDLKANPVNCVSDSIFEFGTIDIFDLDNISLPIEYSTIKAEYGKAAGEYIKKAIDLAMEGEIDAIVTNPIHKESFKLGGWGKKYAGHTEMLADLTGTKDYTMMLSHKDFRVVHVSTHISLRDACNAVKKDRVLKTIKFAYKGCKDLGIEEPRIAVAALNPHASDGSLFGYEEEKEIIPAINEAKKLGYKVDGPVPADTVFSKAKGGMYDIVVCQYHDQGHIPMKFDGFQYNNKEEKWDTVSGVNSTLGLPIIRTSVDHGTAFGKAGKGTATAESLLDAIDVAVKFAKNRNK